MVELVGEVANNSPNVPKLDPGRRVIDLDGMQVREIAPAAELSTESGGCKLKRNAGQLFGLGRLRF